MSVLECISQIGSGARPGDLLPSAGLALSSRGERVSAAEMAARFRALSLPVIGRVQKGAFLLDLRCLEDESALTSQLPKLGLPGAQA